MFTSIIFGVFLLIVYCLPISGYVSPLKVFLAAWSALWIFNGLLAGPFYLSTEAMLMVAFQNLIFVFGALSASLIPLKSAGYIHEENAQGNSSALKIYSIWISIVSGIFFLQIGATQMGISGGLFSVFSSGISGIFETMRSGQASLYVEDEFAVPWGIKLTTLFMVYASIMLGAYVGTDANKKPNKIIWPTYLFLIFGVSMITGVRSFILVAGLLIVFSYLAARVSVRKGRNVISFKMIGVTIASILIFFMWIIVIQSARLQDASFSRISATIEHMRPWFGGYLPALSVWYDFSMPEANLTYGQMLARSFLTPLGLAQGEGLTSRIELESIGNGRTSNAMTIYRAFWSDFGIIGGTFLSYFLGLFSQFVYYKAINRGGVWVPLLGCVYCTVFFSVNYWFFAYGARAVGAGMAIAATGILSSKIFNTHDRLIKK